MAEWKRVTAKLRKDGDVSPIPVINTYLGSLGLSSRNLAAIIQTVLIKNVFNDLEIFPSFLF